MLPGPDHRWQAACACCRHRLQVVRVRPVKDRCDREPPKSYRPGGDRPQSRDGPEVGSSGRELGQGLPAYHERDQLGVSQHQWELRLASASNSSDPMLKDRCPAPLA